MRPARPLVFFVGLVTTFNPLVSLGTLVRVTDLLGLLLAPAVLLRLAVGRCQARTFVFLVLLLAGISVWTAVDVSRGEIPRLPIRWLSAMIIALAAALMIRDLGSSRDFMAGLLVGALLSLLVLFLQFSSDLRSFGPVLFEDPDAKLVYFGHGDLRAVGLYGHPNASAAVVALALPTAVVLSRGRLVGDMVGWGAVVGAYLLTVTRAAVLVSALVWTVLSARLAPRRLVAGALAVVVAILVVGPPGGWERWDDPTELAANGSDRLRTTTEAARIVLLHPVSSGTSFGSEVGQAKFFSVHNAFVQTGLYLGILAPPFFIGAVVAGILWMRRSEPVGALSLQVAGLFMFENHLVNVTFVIILLFIVVIQLEARNRHIDRELFA